MFCNKCGTQLPEGSGFCNKCGAPQGGAAPAADASAPASLTIPQPAAPRKEEDVWRGGYSPRAMGLAYVGSVLWLAGAWVAYLYLAGKEHSDRYNAVVLYTVMVVSPLPGLYALALTLWRKITLHYRLTSQRLFMSVGFLARRVEEIELVRVDDVAVKQGLFDRIFDVGNVAVVSSDRTTPTLIMKGIAGPMSVKEKVRTLVQENRKRMLNIQSV